MQPEDLDLDFDLDLDINIELDDADDRSDLMADYEYTGSAEVDSKAEMSAVKAAFIARAKAEEQRRAKATDSEYWFCVCFQSRAQSEEFLRKTKWADSQAKYLDGVKLARKLGVELVPEKKPSDKIRIKAKLADLAMEV